MWRRQRKGRTTADKMIRALHFQSILSSRLVTSTTTHGMKQWPTPLPVLCSICVHVHACICFSLSVSPVPSLSLSVSLLCVSAQFISTVLIPPRVVLAMQRSGASSASRSRESLHGDEDEDNGRDDAAHAATYHTLTITKGANGFGFRLAGAVHGCAASTTIASHVAVMVLRVCVCATAHISAFLYTLRSHTVHPPPPPLLPPERCRDSRHGSQSQFVRSVDAQSPARRAGELHPFLLLLLPLLLPLMSTSPFSFHFPVLVSLPRVR